MSAFPLAPHDLPGDPPGGRLRPLADAEAAPLAEALAGLEPWRTLGFTAAGLAAYLGREDPALRRFAIERDGGLAGLLAIRSPWLRGPSIELLALLPEAQGGGLGGRAVAWAAAQAAPTSASLWACVSAFNAPARAFYARQGFVEAAILPDLVTAGFDEILVRKRLR